MLPIIRWTMWRRRWSAGWWSLGVLSFILINMVFYPTFKDQADELTKSFASLPKAALQLFGGSSDFFSPVGFLNSQIFFLMLPMLLTILAVALGSSLIAGEEKDGTLETLLARPISRGRVMIAKIIAGTLEMLIVSLVAALTVVISARLVNLDVPSMRIALATINSLLLAYCTGAVAFLLSATGRARGAAIGVAAFIGFGGYMITSLSGTVKWLRGPSHAFPFDYFQSEPILRGTYHWSNALFFLAVTVVCGLLSYVAFRRRDLI